MGISLQEETSLEGFTSREKRMCVSVLGLNYQTQASWDPRDALPAAFICPNPRFVRVRGARELAALPLEILLL